jgi:large subunit ribosomal protein L17
MRHCKHTSKLNRTSEHRLALMRNLAVALVENERIQTTVAKAKQLRPFVEPLITRAKTGDLASRRLIAGRLQSVSAAGKLIGVLAPRVAQRPGGYLRIVKAGPRMGDGAPMAYIEFVDEAPKTEGAEPAKPKTLKKRLHERRKEMAKVRR